MRILKVCLLGLCALLAQPSWATLWTFSGHGTGTHSGGESERLRFSFTYDDAWFNRGTSVVCCDFDAPHERFDGMKFRSSQPIQVSLTGSRSGSFDVKPLTGLEMWHEPLFSSYGFLGGGPAGFADYESPFFYCDRPNQAGCGDYDYKGLWDLERPGTALAVNEALANIISGRWQTDAGLWPDVSENWANFSIRSGGKVSMDLHGYSWDRGTSVPEPASGAVLAIALAALGLVRRQRRRAQR